MIGTAGIGAAALVGAGHLAGGTLPGPSAVLAAGFGPLGLFVLRRLPGHPVGRLMAGAGAAAAAGALATAWTTWTPAAWVSQWAWWPPLAVTGLILLVLPDGRLPSPRWRPVAGLIVLAGVVATLALAVAALAQPRILLDTTGAAGPSVRPVLAVALGAIVVTLAGTAAAAGSLALRRRRAGPLVRGQLACLAPAGAILVTGLVLELVAGVPGAWAAGLAAVPLGFTVAVLRFRLDDLDLHLHRGTVWLVLTALAVGGYAAVVTAADALPGVGGTGASLLGAGVVAALLLPAERLAQRAVNRLLYGRRDDPLAVFTRLARQWHAVSDPLAVLPRIARTVAEGLNLPHVAVALTGPDGGATVVAEHGRRTPDPAGFPMVVRGRTVGELRAAPRTVGTRFGPREAALLADLAAQAAPAADAVRVAVELRRARDRLVRAREEERRRLRRELHDGVGSALAGGRMLTEALRRTVGDGGSAPALLAALQGDLEKAITEVRALIDDLRPAALDDGLATALHGLARCDGAGPLVEVSVRGSPDGLPAAVEVAAYRIAAEAVANAVRHSGARRCTVTAHRRDRELALDVLDDGAGLAAGAAGSGTGTASIAERADELGGDATFGPGPGGGTLVRVRLPLDT
ncbi:sensor histidine kinase [Pseudonocardia alni]|uniref:sensor histidine kinase n=1 Tax=Pseudonocardia alni TaxID=33907 RepID=UPI00279B3F08|nr:sensor histidine kinase [Pseudonocardia alni]